MQGTRRIPLRTRPSLLTATLVAVTLAACGAPGVTDDPSPVTAAAGTSVRAPGSATPAGGAPATDASPGQLGLGRTTSRAGTVIATVGGLELVLPAPGGILVAFHEGSSVAAELTPALPTRAVLNSGANATVDRDDRVGQLQAMVLPSRRRAAAATSAVDVVVPPSVPILAPVTGTVVAAGPYALYGSHEDVKVVIRSDAAPDLEVLVLHLTDAAVAPGDHVVAGETRIAGGARALDVGSQVDRFTVRSWREDPPPHVHLEVRPHG